MLHLIGVIIADDNTLSRKGDVRLKATFTSQDANRVIKYPNGTYQLAETSDYTCTPVVISRISEMYLIKAEALGKTNGAAALVEYMKKRPLQVKQQSKLYRTKNIRH